MSDVFKKGVKYIRDELSAKFGDMTSSEFDELCADIKTNGQREPIIVKGNKIIDGWHRYQACLKVGATPDMDEYNPQYDGKSVEAFVLSKNLFRRHYSPEQRAQMAIEVTGYKPSRGGKPSHDGLTAKKLATIAGVSLSTVERQAAKLKPSSDGLKKEPTLEELQKREKMLLGQLESVRAQISALSKKPRLRSK